MADVITVRSLEDVAYLLNILFFNMNNLSRVYYDMFINPEPMDIDLQRYDEAGNLVTITLPNRAKDVIQAYTGNGNPNGVQVAKVGAFYIDVLTSSLYYKGSGTDAYGWILVYSAVNSDYLKPDGNGSQLTNLNASAINSGTLAVNYGGTGGNSFNGLLKGNGTDPMTNAEDGVDFMGPISTVGIICYYPVSSIPTGWLLCDGSAYSRVTYSRLFNKIGVQYGEGNGTTTFNVPNLMGYFIRGWDNTREVNVPQEGAVGGHTHTLTGSTGAGTAHSHTRGTMNITGSIDSLTNRNDCLGAFYLSSPGSGWHPNGESNSNRRKVNFDASRNWTGSTSSESSHTHSLTNGSAANNAEGVENMVKNFGMFPIIKY